LSSSRELLCSAAPFIGPKSHGPSSHRQRPRDLEKLICRREKQKELPYEKINPDPYAYTKRTAGRFATTPALRSHPIGSASYTPQARACRPLECPHLAVARAHGAKAGRRFRQALCRKRPAPHLNLSRSQWPCLPKFTPTASSGNRFTTTCHCGHGM